MKKAATKPVISKMFMLENMEVKFSIGMLIPYFITANEIIAETKAINPVVKLIKEKLFSKLEILSIIFQPPLHNFCLL